MTVAEQSLLVPSVENNLVELSELMASKVGSVNPKSFLDETFELFSIPAFDKGSAEIETGSAIGSSKQNVMPGDVLLSKIVPHIRRSWIVTPNQGHRQIASGEWIVFRDARIHGPYLRQILVSDHFNAQFMRTVAGVGGSLLRARPSHVAKIQISLPPLPEQVRIAAILDTADHLRTQRREALAHLDALTQSIFDGMFGDPAANAKNWAKQSFSALLSAIERGRSPVCLDRPASEGEWGILKLGAISKQSWIPGQNKALTESEPDVRFEVSAGDVLFSRKNTPELVATVCLVTQTPPKLLLPDLIFRLRIASPTVMNNVFLATVLQHTNQRSEIRSMATGSARSMVNISKAKLMTVQVPVPPLALQQIFARRVAGIERLKDQHRTQLAELDTLFASLQHCAFIGELQVKAAEPYVSGWDGTMSRQSKK